jgi:asparagine synthase (glutamine-hydrolysing)
VISLGATRLRILDLESGDQPLVGPDGDVVVVFNGEIFNHNELRSELESHGARFETRCDTEVILHAFLHWGSECFARLRGMFAVALWVQSERRLFLARDRTGIKPLYYCEQEGEIYFGSELKCIFAHPEVPRRICMAGLNCFLSLNYVPAPYTLVEGIHKLMPGHLLEWHSGRSSVRSFVPLPAVLSAPRSIGQACEELDGLLTDSVKEQLASDVPVGIWLSGGLDSSTILRYASQISSSRLRTFSITFKGRSFDESGSIKEISSHFGSQHTEFNLDESADLENAIQQMAFYSDEPSADAGALPAWFLAQMSRKQVTVVLTGEGADELFAGYLTYKADRYSAVARRFPAGLRRAALACARRLPVSDEKISFEYKLKRFLQGSLLSPEMAHVFWNGTFSEAEKDGFYLFADTSPLAGMLSGMSKGTGLQRYLDFDQRYYLSDDILYKVDRMSMAHSLEARPPFLDSRIIDFAARLPERFKLHGSTSKYVLRQLMKDKLPSNVLRRPKIGFDIPIHEWFRGVLQPLLLDTLSEDAVRASQLFRWSAVERLLTDHLERKANLGYHLWGLMVLLLWIKQWNIEPGAGEFRAPDAVPEVLDRVGSL